MDKNPGLAHFFQFFLIVSINLIVYRFMIATITFIPVFLIFKF